MDVEKIPAQAREDWALFDAAFKADPAGPGIEALIASEEHAQRALALCPVLTAAYDAAWRDYLALLARPGQEALLAAFVRALAFHPYEGKDYRLVRALFLRGYAETQGKILAALRALPISRHAADFLEAGFREAANADRAIKARGDDIAPALLRKALDTGEASIGTPLFVVFIHKRYALLCRGFFSYELNEMDFKDLRLNRDFDPERCLRAIRGG